MSETCVTCGASGPGGVICQACAARLRDALVQVPGLLVDLDDNLAGLVTHQPTPNPRRPVPDLVSVREAAGLVGVPVVVLVRDLGAAGLVSWDGPWWDVAVVAGWAESVGLGDVARSLRHPELTAAVTRLPMSVAASDAAEVLRGVCRSWAGVLHGDTGEVFEGSCHALWLAGRVQVVRQRPWAGQCQGQVVRAVAAGLCVVDVAVEPVTIGSCPGCGCHLTAQPGAVVVTCRCGAVVDTVQARDAHLAAAMDKVLPARTVAAAMTTGGREVTPSMIRGWVARDARLGCGGLVSVGVDGAGRPLYRLGDVVARWYRSRGVDRS